MKIKSKEPLLFQDATALIDCLIQCDHEQSSKIITMIQETIAVIEARLTRADDEWTDTINKDDVIDPGTVDHISTLKQIKDLLAIIEVKKQRHEKVSTDSTNDLINLMGKLYAQFTTDSDFKNWVRGKVNGKKGGKSSSTKKLLIEEITKDFCNREPEIEAHIVWRQFSKEYHWNGEPENVAYFLDDGEIAFVCETDDIKKDGRLYEGGARLPIKYSTWYTEYFLKAKKDLE